MVSIFHLFCFDSSLSHSTKKINHVPHLRGAIRPYLGSRVYIGWHWGTSDSRKRKAHKARKSHHTKARRRRSPTSWALLALTTSVVWSCGRGNRRRYDRIGVGDIYHTTTVPEGKMEHPHTDNNNRKFRATTCWCPTHQSLFAYTLEVHLWMIVASLPNRTDLVIIHNKRFLVIIVIVCELCVFDNLYVHVLFW